MESDYIYHIVSISDYKKNIICSMYAPESLLKQGFIHCTAGEKTTLLVAEDYFPGFQTKIYLLKIIKDAVLAPVRFENAVKEPSSGRKHLDSTSLFPHIYGSLNLDSIEGIGILIRPVNKFLWPDTFYPYFSDIM
jgi:uncharacterized protein (DUF952 family)